MSKVFISYSHDTPEHKELVLALSERLREDGIETSLDRYPSGTPSQGWPRWMMDQIDWADFALLICTETYYRRFRGHEIPGKGKGADWEGAIITQEIYDSKSSTKKYVPVLLRSEDEQFIPEPARCHTHYLLNSGDAYESLYDFLSGQAGVVPRPVGEIKIKKQIKVEPLTFNKITPPSKHSPQIAPTRLTLGAERLFGREAEIAAIDNAWDDPKTHVFSVVAFGGTGKTSLIFEWMNRKAVTDFLGIERIFDWSFYSMGTREQGDASSDSFVKAALIFFGDKEMAESAASAWDKGARLAALVSERSTLLILDGLEPLQYPPGQQTGQLKDPAVKTLLKGLARNNPGLCVVTTRESITDLAPFHDTTAKELPLDRLSTPAGIALLKHLGIRGCDVEFEKLVEDVKGHALTLNLLGRYLTEAHGGDIRKRDMVNIQEADDEIQGGHAFRVIEAYEKWFAGEKKEGRRLLAVLNLLALFDRPADYKCIESLRKPPAINGLTENLVNQGKAKWNITLNRLQQCGLISLLSPTGGVWVDGASLDTHPIIREYFARQLQKLHLPSWKTGHRRLYEYLTENTHDKRHPTLEDLMPLYQAVFHGCQAGLYEHARNKVYADRILRRSECYSGKKLGAYGANLGAVACFFKDPWSEIFPSLSDEVEAWLMNEAGFNLSALGRLTEALLPFNAGLEMRIKHLNFGNATRVAHNLSDLKLTLGILTEAIASYEHTIKLSDQSDDLFLAMTTHAGLANAQYQVGQKDRAGVNFQVATALQIQSQSEYPILYSLPGFYYCSFLLDSIERRAWQILLGSGCEQENIAAPNYSAEVQALNEIANDVKAKVEQTLVWSIHHKYPQDIALDNLSLGNIALFQEMLYYKDAAHPIDFNATKKNITATLDNLRFAGMMEYLPLALLAQGLLQFLEGDTDSAQTNLNEAWEIAERGPMRLHMIDILLYRARLFKDNDALRQARALIEYCGYWRRKDELEDAEAVSGSWP